MKLRCYHCKGPFGLTRHHAKGRAFCCQRCVDAWLDRLAILRNFLYSKPPDELDPALFRPPDSVPGA
jgi:hypothetical protein